MQDAAASVAQRHQIQKWLISMSTWVRSACWVGDGLDSDIKLKCGWPARRCRSFLPRVSMVMKWSAHHVFDAMMALCTEACW